jgi:hypothetical protein
MPTSSTLKRDLLLGSLLVCDQQLLEAQFLCLHLANTGGGAATGNPILAKGTQLGNPNIRPGSLRERAALANAARETTTKPVHQQNQ